MAAKQEIFREKLGEHLGASKQEKGRILDAVCRITGGNRKAAIRRFRTLQIRLSPGEKKRGRKTIYGHRLIPLIRELWEMSGRRRAKALNRLHCACHSPYKVSIQIQGASSSIGI